MIRMNLLGEKKDYSDLIFKHSLLLGITIFIAFSLSSSARYYFSNRLEQVKEEKEGVDKELVQLRSVTKDLDDLEKKKKVLKEKLAIISRLQLNKYSAVKFLDDMTVAIPERSWLTGIKPGKGGLVVQGIALDSQTVSSFIHNLESSTWVQAIDFGYTKQTLIEEVPVQEFLFTVRVKGMITEHKNNPQQKAKS